MTIWSPLNVNQDPIATRYYNYTILERESHDTNEGREEKNKTNNNDTRYSCTRFERLRGYRFEMSIIAIRCIANGRVQ